MTLNLHRWGETTGPKLIAIHGFADDGAAFARLADTGLCRSLELIAPDLPGFGASPVADGFAATIADYADAVLALADRVCPNAPVGLIAHSVGSAIAVEAALKAPHRISALLSVEGNLTTADAYFSGQAANFETAAAFKPSFIAHIEALAAKDPKLKRYLAATRNANAEAMWRLGRDAAHKGVDDSFGRAYLNVRDLGVSSLYLWGRHNTPAETAAFIDTHDALNAIEFDNAGHWAFEDAPQEVAAHALDLFLPSQA